MNSVLGNSVSDQYSFDTDPDPIRIQGFDEKKLWLKKFLFFVQKLPIPRPP
jgi:hypothetical protein